MAQAIRAVRALKWSTLPKQRKAPKWVDTFLPTFFVRVFMNGKQRAGDSNVCHIIFVTKRCLTNHENHRQIETWISQIWVPKHRFLESGRKVRRVPKRTLKTLKHIFEQTFDSVPQVGSQIFFTRLGKSWNPLTKTAATHLF